MPIVAVDGLKIAYESAGEGPAVLFIHGLGGNRNLWHGQLATVSRHRRAIAFDLPGAGNSDPDPQGYSIPRWCAQIDALATALKVTGKMVVVGHSMATVTAVRFALDHPDRTAALVLVGALTGPAPGLVERTRKVEADGMLSVVDAILGGQFTAGTLAGNPSLAGLLRSALCGNSPVPYCGHCRSLESFSVKDDLAKLKVPVLYLVGDQDMVTPMSASIAGVKAIGANARVHVLANAAHTPHVERTAEFNAALMNFLAELA